MSDRHPDSEIEDKAPVASKARGAKTGLLKGRQRAQAVLRDVEVTQEDIDNAMPKDSHACMIADAIKRKYPEFRTVDQVDGTGKAASVYGVDASAV